MLTRVAMGLGGILAVAVAGLASMVRIVPADQVAIAPTVVPQATEAVPPTPAGAITVPVQGVSRRQITDTWGQSRANGAREHHGTDIMAAGGTPVVAAAPGSVEKLFYSHGGGGISMYVRSPDRLWSYYYAHLQGYAPGVVEGMTVKAGELIGYVGDTGNSGLGNYHLHFGMSRMQPGDGWWKGQPVNPYPLLAGTGQGR
jgi:peptidoglycan LD-endopeptidase LytH